jgi:hypothetical protein
MRALIIGAWRRRADDSLALGQAGIEPRRGTGPWDSGPAGGRSHPRRRFTCQAWRPSRMVVADVAAHAPSPSLKC